MKGKKGGKNKGNKHAVKPEDMRKMTPRKGKDSAKKKGAKRGYKDMGMGTLWVALNTPVDNTGRS